MRPNRPKLKTIAAWLGVMALSLNALFPVRYAFGLAADFANARECGHNQVGVQAQVSDATWQILALLTGHDTNADPSRSHGGLHPVGGALCSFAANHPGFAAPAAVTAAVPAPRALTLAAAVTPRHSPQAVPAAYRSRAPPIRTA
jgi:hypothetical protein